MLSKLICSSRVIYHTLLQVTLTLCLLGAPLAKGQETNLNEQLTQLLQQNRSQEVIDILSAPIAYIDLADFYQFRSTAYFQLKRYQQALDDSRQGLAFSNDNPDLNIVHAGSLFFLNRIDEFEDHVTKRLQSENITNYERDTLSSWQREVGKIQDFQFQYSIPETIQPVFNVTDVPTGSNLTAIREALPNLTVDLPQDGWNIQFAMDSSVSYYFSPRRHLTYSLGFNINWFRNLAFSASEESYSSYTIASGLSYTTLLLQGRYLQTIAYLARRSGNDNPLSVSSYSLEVKWGHLYILSSELAIRINPSLGYRWLDNASKGSEVGMSTALIFTFPLTESINSKLELTASWQGTNLNNKLNASAILGFSIPYEIELENGTIITTTAGIASRNFHSYPARIRLERIYSADVTVELPTNFIGDDFPLRPSFSYSYAYKDSTIAFQSEHINDFKIHFKSNF